MAFYDNNAYNKPGSSSHRGQTWQALSFLASSFAISSYYLFTIQRIVIYFLAEKNNTVPVVYDSISVNPADSKNNWSSFWLYTLTSPVLENGNTTVLASQRTTGEKNGSAIRTFPFFFNTRIHSLAKTWGVSKWWNAQDTVIKSTSVLCLIWTSRSILIIL